MAAEQDGKLPRPTVNEELAESLVREFGYQVDNLVRVAHRHVNALSFAFSYLRPLDVFEVASIAAQRAAVQGPDGLSLADYWNATPDSSIRQREQIGDALEDRIAQLGYDAQVELKALMWVGRPGGGDDYAVALDYAKSDHDEHIPNYLAEKQMLHWMLADGLRMVGKPGEDILAAYPLMQQWSRYYASDE